MRILSKQSKRLQQFKTIHEAQTKLFMLANATGDDKGENLMDLTVIELKDICRTHGLTVGGRKADIVERLTSFMETLSTIDEDDAKELIDRNENVQPFVQNPYVLKCSFVLVHISYNLFRCVKDFPIELSALFRE